MLLLVGGAHERPVVMPVPVSVSNMLVTCRSLNCFTSSRLTVLNVNKILRTFDSARLLQMLHSDLAQEEFTK